MFNDYILLGIGLIFNFYVPGYVFVNLFAKELKNIYKIPLIFLMSILLSTNLIYLTALIFGFNTLVVFSIYALWLILFFFTKSRLSFNKKHIGILILSSLVFVIFVLSLFPAIFYKYKDYYVMSADNWQDTALHLSLIQSFTQGNFPPQAPYFSGRDLNYHYFSDLHTAIILLPLDKFYPRFLIIDNSLFAAIYVLGVYSLAFFLTKKVRTSLIASFLSVFSGSFIFLNFIRDYLNGLGSIKQLILNGSYVLEYGGLYQMTPITNYFLQNRPMMIGLISIVLSFLLIFQRKYYLVLFVAILTWKFQIFSSLIIFLALVLYSFINKVEKKIHG